jgi:hypothetical protein
MPELYGNKFKWQLRKEIRELGVELWNERKAHRETRAGLRYAQCKIAELEEKVKRMEQAARGLLNEATEDIEAKVGERFSQTILRRRIA